MSSKVIKLTWTEVAEMVRTELRKIIGKDVFCVAKSDDDTYAVVSVPWRHIRRKTQNHRPCKTGRKSLSRVAQLVPANKADFLFVADSGPGETNEKGLIVPKFGNKPENHVAVMMSFESLSEMFLITRMHYQCWLTLWYQQNANQPAQKQGQYSENQKEPYSSSVQMF